MFPFCREFKTRLRRISVEVRFCFSPKGPIVEQSTIGCEFAYFFVIYKSFKIYITISLQYNYCLVWLSCSSFSKSILSLSHFQFTVSQIMATFFFFACAGLWIVWNWFFVCFKTFVRKLFAIEKFVVRCSLGAQQIGYFIWIIYLFFFLFVILASNYSTENVQHLAKQIFNSNTTQHKWWLEWLAWISL